MNGIYQTKKKRNYETLETGIEVEWLVEMLKAAQKLTFYEPFLILDRITQIAQLHSC